MAAVSAISTMNVDWPRARSSEAPTRVKMRSTRPMRARDAGTKLPACASRTVSATCRSNVLFPAMFGPVSTTSWERVRSRTRSLGTKGSAETLRSTTG